MQCPQDAAAKKRGGRKEKNALSYEYEALSYVHAALSY
jgi:hypothetical protein